MAFVVQRLPSKTPPEEPLDAMRFHLRTLLLLQALIAGYFASYVALMQPTIYVVDGSIFGSSGYRAPGFRFGEPVARVIFWPAAWLDQELRPDYWGPYRD